MWIYGYVTVTTNAVMLPCCVYNKRKHLCFDVSLTNDWVDVLGSILSKSTDTGTLSRHSKAGQWPLAVHILTNHRTHLPNTCQPVGWRGAEAWGSRWCVCVSVCVKRTELAESGLTQSDGWVWCLWVQRCELCLCHWMRTRRMSHGWSWCWKEKPQVSFYNCQTGHSVALLH